MPRRRVASAKKNQGPRDPLSRRPAFAWANSGNVVEWGTLSERVVDQPVLGFCSGSSRLDVDICIFNTHFSAPSNLGQAWNQQPRDLFCVVRFVRDAARQITKRASTVNTLSIMKCMSTAQERESRNSRDDSICVRFSANADPACLQRPSTLRMQRKRRNQTNSGFAGWCAIT